MEMAENLVHIGLSVTLIEGAGQVIKNDRPCLMPSLMICSNIDFLRERERERERERQRQTDRQRQRQRQRETKRETKRWRGRERDRQRERERERERFLTVRVT